MGALSLEIDSLRALVESLRTENEHLLESTSPLAASREDYVDLFESAPLPSLLIDERGIILSSNDEAVRLLVTTERGLVGRRLREFIAPEDRSVLATHFDRCARSEAPDTCELRLRIAKAPGPLVQLSSRRSRRQRSVLQTILLDLSGHEREKVERAQLLEAAESARKASSAKDRFIAMLSHELRTPLTPVLVAASALRNRADLPPPIRDTLGMIVRCVNLESRLIDDLLDVTRIAQGKMRFERVPTDVHGIVHRVCEALAPDLAAKKQSVWTELRAEQELAEVDPTRMFQLFSNLLRNAIKFSPVGAAIQVRSWNAQSKLMVEVEDRGVGIEAEELSRIFEPFEQLPVGGASATGTPGGLGLGLTICKGIVELHGGRLDAASRGRGLGARFVVQLPTTTRPEAEALPDTALRVPLTAKDKRCRVLLVEDHADTAEVLAELLVSYGYEVAAAASLHDALAVDLGNVDVIVSDLGLPDGDGLELIRTLQKSGHHPAIALSGFGMESDVKASIEAGFDVHLTKPVDAEKLVGTIRSLGGQSNGD
jgi:two-component system CheB/CheR fusion protein